MPAGVQTVNIPELLAHSCRAHPEKTYLYYQDQEISYGVFLDNIYRTANWFKRLGLEKGDRVCLILPNCPEFLYMWLGLSLIGGVAVPVNVAYKQQEAAFILRHSECCILAGTSETLRTVEELVPSLHHLQSVVHIGKGPAATAGVLEFSSFMDEEPRPDPTSEPSAKDVACIMYTSGTTGPPKGVMVTHFAYVSCGQGFTRWVELTEHDRLFTCLPLYHANAQYYSTMGSLAAGAGLILVDRFSATRFWNQIRRYGATVFNYIGAMLVILMKQPESPDDRRNPVRVAYGTPALDNDFQDRFERRFDLKLITGYALTECVFGTIQPLRGLRKVKSIGLPRSHPDFENLMKVVDDQGRALPPGETGEIVIKNPAVTPGYFRNPEATEKTLQDGWLHTGDNAYRDEDGYFFFVDRKKDVIRRRGENISSLEIEATLNEHPCILESAVVGVPSELSDEEVKAYVVPVSGMQVNPEDIFAWCEQRLARFKVPRYLEIRDSLPKTPTHRVAKYVLRQEKENPAEGCADRERLSGRSPERRGTACEKL
jgi:crotonobetaine/carnitine-CoA ligase